MAEEIGRRVAQELTSNFAKLGSDLVAQQSKANFAAETFASLRRAITLELRGFNQVVQREFRLTMLPGQNCLIFSFESRLALTLKVDLARVRLILDPPNNLTLRAEDGRASIEFTVYQDGDRFTYQRIPTPPQTTTRVCHSRTLSKASYAWRAVSLLNAHQWTTQAECVRMPDLLPISDSLTRYPVRVYRNNAHRPADSPGALDLLGFPAALLRGHRRSE